MTVKSAGRAGLVVACALAAGCNSRDVTRTNGPGVAVNISMLSPPSSDCTVNYTAEYWDTTGSQWIKIAGPKSYSGASYPTFSAVDEIPAASGTQITALVTALLVCGSWGSAGTCLSAPVTIPEPQFNGADGTLINSKPALSVTCTFEVPVSAGATIVHFASQYDKDVCQNTRTVLDEAYFTSGQGDVAQSFGVFAPKSRSIFLGVESYDLVPDFDEFEGPVYGLNGLWESHLGYLNITTILQLRGLAITTSTLADTLVRLGRPVGETGVIHVGGGNHPAFPSCKTERGFNAAVTAQELDVNIDPVVGRSSLANCRVVTGGDGLSRLVWTGMNTRSAYDFVTYDRNQFSEATSAAIDAPLSVRGDALLNAVNLGFTPYNAGVVGFEGERYGAVPPQSQAGIQFDGYVTYELQGQIHRIGYSVGCKIAEQTGGGGQFVGF